MERWFQNFPLGVKPLTQNFTIRNRVISGLSIGIVVTEARKKRSAKITTAFALEKNREVFAYRGVLIPLQIPVVTV